MAPKPTTVSVGQVSRIVECVLDATPAEYAGGLAWYEAFGAACARQALFTPFSADDAVAIFAALSARTRIQQNWEAFTAALADRSVLNVRRAVPCQRNKVRLFLKGAISRAELLASDKVSRFYLNLMGDSSVVTVDTHAAACALGARVDSFSHAQYLQIEAAYQVAAAELGITPAACQAVAWVVWRRQHGIADDGGLSLVA